jgi:regulator of nonsense transcripts 2
VISGEVQRSDFEDEDIIVTRQEEERDPEADAEFDRELAKMMAESLDARKFERKSQFDVPLPMKRSVVRDAPAEAEEDVEQARSHPPNTMAFSLLTKRGNRQQAGRFQPSYPSI